MAYPAQIYRVMVASPSDTEDIRRGIRRIIDDHNDEHAETYGFVLLPYMWEAEAAPSSGRRVQENINSQLVHPADILVGIFRLKFGKESGDYRSATEEEIETFCNPEAGRNPGVIFYKGALKSRTPQADLIRRYRKELQGRPFLVLDYADDTDAIFRAMQSIRHQAKELESARLKTLEQGEPGAPLGEEILPSVPDASEPVDKPGKTSMPAFKFPMSESTQEAIRKANEMAKRQIMESMSAQTLGISKEFAKQILSGIQMPRVNHSPNSPLFPYATTGGPVTAKFGSPNWIFHMDNGGNSWELEKSGLTVETLHSARIFAKAAYIAPFELALEVKNIDAEFIPPDVYTFEIPEGFTSVIETAEIEFTHSQKGKNVEVTRLKLAY